MNVNEGATHQQNFEEVSNIYVKKLYSAYVGWMISLECVRLRFSVCVCVTDWLGGCEFAGVRERERES